MSAFDDVFGDCMYTNERALRSARFQILAEKTAFEGRLDEMWSIYLKGITRQIVEYRKQVDDIKHCGLKVLRNSAGKHKIVDV